MNRRIERWEEKCVLSNESHKRIERKVEGKKKLVRERERKQTAVELSSCQVTVSSVMHIGALICGGEG